MIAISSPIVQNMYFKPNDRVKLHRVYPETGKLAIFGCAYRRRTTMCDVNVFIRKNGMEEKVLENVDIIEEVAGGMRLVNIFGEERTLNARMVSYNNSEKRMIFQSL
ncbi:MAG: hypothetical protein CSA23_02060 [Deltaproteobacteria bacterium]|nr:MAG: hypothetical protein CSA23_02060 [Deltaproteobacteria bacterium]